MIYYGFQIASECQRGVEYGTNCSKLFTDRHCYYTLVRSCDRYTGVCLQGCQPGWGGVDCTQGILLNCY